jgi:hypothetical protein
MTAYIHVPILQRRQAAKMSSASIAVIVVGIMVLATVAMAYGAQAIIANQEAKMGDRRTGANLQGSSLNQTLALDNKAGQTSTTTISVTVTSTQTVTVNQTITANFPFNYPEYLTASNTCGYTSGNGTSYPSPCFTNVFSAIHLFDCDPASSTQSGCTQVVVSSLDPKWNYTINIRHPYLNQMNEPSWANCVYTVEGTAFVSQYAYCISISPTAFILSQPGALPG